MRKNPPNNKDKRRNEGIYPIRIVELAKQLDVTPGHLSRVVHGERKSPLLERYNKLVEACR